MRIIIECLMVVSFLNVQVAGATGLKAQPFQTQDVALLNNLKDSHQLFKRYLDLKSSSPELVIQAKKHLSQKAFKLPKFSLLKEGLIEFKFESQKYKLGKESDHSFKLNGKLIDINTHDWQTDVSFFKNPLLAPLFIEKAHAVAPIVYILAAIIVGTLVACSAPDASVLNMGELKAKHIRVGSPEFNKAIKAIRSSLCSAGCGIACADTIDTFDYSKYMSGLCSHIAQGYKSQDELEKSFTKNEKIINPRQYPRTEFMAHVGRDGYEYSQAHEVQDLATEKLIAGLTSDQEFMKACVTESLSVTPSEAHPDSHEAEINY